MKYYIIAGERSGDLHGSNFIKALKTLDTSAEIRGWGGDYMRDAGMVLVKHYREMAFMGFLEVVQNLGTIKKYLKECKEDILTYQPDVVILIDYAGFNLRIAKFSKVLGIKTFYYISPKVWAWNTGRANKIKRIVDRMFVILPFEKEFYKKFDYEVDYVGNPLLDAIREHQVNPNFISDNQLDDKPIIAVLPGSRKQELDNILTPMLQLTSRFKEYQFIVAGVDNLSEELYAPAKANGIKVIYGQTYDLLSQAHAAVVTSGTATLETALWNVPQVVCYKTSWISYQIAKALIKVDYISLVNLIGGKEVVKELIQSDLNAVNLEHELKNILEGQGRVNVLSDYQNLQQMMGNEKASQNLARLVVKYLNEGNA